MERILAIPLETLRKMTRKERIDANLCDPVRLFVKNEPHKKSKLDEGRVRLISSVSTPDKTIEWVLYKHLCELEINNWKDIPSKPGIGFTEESNEAVYDDIINSGLDMASSDVRGWDMGVKQYEIEDNAERIILLCDNPSEDWQHLVRAKAILESESIYQFSDGVLVEPTFPGLVNSGKLMTSCGNSWMRVRKADLVGSRKTIAAGDDCIESYVPDAVAKYLALGIVIKQYEPIKDEFEFCSRVYKNGSSYAVNRTKMLMNLLHTKPKNHHEYEMYMTGFRAELSSRPDFPEIMRIVDAVGYNVVAGPHINAINNELQEDSQNE